MSKDRSFVDDLCDILNESKVKVTFDMYRDSTKGCGDHCKGWNSKADSWCDNHKNAMFSGDYLADGDIKKTYQDYIETLRTEIKELEQTLKYRDEDILALRETIKKERKITKEEKHD